MNNILKILKQTRALGSEKISAFLKKNNSFTVSGLTSLLRLLLLAQISSEKRTVFVTSTEQIALKYKHDLKKLFDIEAKIFPYQDISTYDGVSSNLYKYSQQVEILQNLENIPLLLVPVKALLEKFPDCSPGNDFYKNYALNIKIDDEIDTSKIAQKLIDLGYKRVTMVSDIGEFSIRGDIIDVYSLNRYASRIELWGDTVTDIRYFDNKTQRSVKKAKETTIMPVYKFVLDDAAKETFKNELIEATVNLETMQTPENADLVREMLAETLEKIDEEGYFEGIEYFQSYLNKGMKNLTQLLCGAGGASVGKSGTLAAIPSDARAESAADLQGKNPGPALVFDESSEIFSKFGQIDENYKKQIDENTQKALALPLKTPAHLEFSDFQTSVAKLQKIFFDNFLDNVSDYTVEFESSLIPCFSSKMEDILTFCEQKIKEGYKVVIATDYRNRVEEVFCDFEIPVSDDFGAKNAVYVTENIALGGSLIEDFKLVVLTDKELFNKKSKDITAKKQAYHKESAEYIESVNDIQEGEYVVHQVHGVGLYKGLSKQEIDGMMKDYLTIEYAQGDKLHMPAEQINLLVRYRGAGAVAPKLSRMGGNDWNTTKTRAKKAIEDIAKDLLRLYAKRSASQGIAFEPDTVWQCEMEEAFEYTETPDQMRAIQETKADMELDKPMDRLICADVGFGKTEIAIRAIFKAVMSGKQAAVVVPTTILAMQHYQTISERFKPFPVKVELLSRFRTAKEQKETVRKLITGDVDVVIGTHRLLQDDIAFKDLGLLVIDEEHRFGVKHKEKLKMLRKNIDILSMSATPIPRTLYMSLSGIKNMSVINTAPMNRLPVKTHVGQYNETFVKNAINHELDRDGQVFFLYNRVETIYKFAAEVQKIVPDARIAVAHGQMDAKTLEGIMLEYAEHKYDILLCTTIIESGLDIPNANTMIIYDADRFGLAQLYQLRGRVGRSDRQAYCYCFYGKSTGGRGLEDKDTGTGNKTAKSTVVGKKASNPDGKDLTDTRKKLTPEAIQRLNAIKEFSTLGGGYQIALRDIEIRGVGNILGTKQHGHMTSVGFDTYCQLLEETINELQETGEKPQPPAIVDINVTAFIPDDWVGSKEQKMIEYKRLADVKNVEELDAIHQEWRDRFSKIPESVENLIKLIHLRLLATAAKISLVRETPDNIRIYMPFNKAEWAIIASRLDRNITKYIKYTIAPKSCQDGNSILLFNNSVLSFKEVFNILSDLFYYINKISHEYTNKEL